MRSFNLANLLLLIWLGWGCALMVLPESTQLAWRDRLRDGHAVGLWTVARLREQVPFPVGTDSQRGPQAGNNDTNSEQNGDEKDSAADERLRREVVVLRERLERQRQQSWRGSSSAGLFLPELVTARRLLPDQRETWQQGVWVSAGRKQQVGERDWILSAELPLIDLGEDHDLQPDQLVLAGRQILGQVDRVGWWTSTFRPLSHERFRCPAVVMNAKTGLLEEKSVGSLHGTGEETCELKYIENTQPVAVGDFVVLSDPEQRFGVPLILGTVVEARVLSSSPFWSIRVEPTSLETSGREVQVLTERLNQSRLATRPAAAETGSKTQ